MLVFSTVDNVSVEMITINTGKLLKIIAELHVQATASNTVVGRGKALFT